MIEMLFCIAYLHTTPLMSNIKYYNKEFNYGWKCNNYNIVYVISNIYIYF